MPPRSESPVEISDRSKDLFVLALLAPIVGAISGFLGATFRLALAQADRVRNELIGWTQGQKTIGFLLLMTSCASACAIAALLVRRYAPREYGSRVPSVQAGPRLGLVDGS